VTCRRLFIAHVDEAPAVSKPQMRRWRSQTLCVGEAPRPDASDRLSG